MRRAGSTSDGTIRILLVMRGGVIRRAITELLEKDRRALVVAQSGSLDEAISLAHKSKPSVILAGDYELDPLVAAHSIRKDLPFEIPVVVLTGAANLEVLLRALRVGIAGYLDTDITPEALVGALQAVLGGVSVFGHSARRVIGSAVPTMLVEWSGRPLPDSLTPREAEVLALVKRGLVTKEISAQLGIGNRTVEMHVAHLTEKFGVHSRTELVLRTLQIGARVDGA